jgi:hypothetical protein
LEKWWSERGAWHATQPEHVLRLHGVVPRQWRPGKGLFAQVRITSGKPARGPGGLAHQIVHSFFSNFLGQKFLGSNL